VAATEYVEIPMETYACAPLYSPRAARLYVAGSAASTAVATCNVICVDDTGTQVADMGKGASRDFNFDNAVLLWTSAMVNPNTNFWYPLTQAHLDGLSVRFGFSGDATPDVGLHTILIELAVQPAVAIGIYESNGCSLYVRQDPVSGAAISYLVTTPAGLGATFTHALAGVDQTPIAVAANTVYEHSIGASAVADVTSVGLAPDPS